MSNVNFHQYFSAELKEFHAILMYQQESYSKKIKESGSDSEFDETETLVKLKEATDTASEFFRGFSDLLAEGKMEKIKMNIQAILSYIESSNNTYLKDYTKLFDEALELSKNKPEDKIGEYQFILTTGNKRHPAKYEDFIKLRFNKSDSDFILKKRT